MTPGDIRALQEQIARLADSLETYDTHTLGECLERYERDYLTADQLSAHTIDWRRRAVARLAQYAEQPIGRSWRPVAVEIYRRYPKPTAGLIVATLARVLSLAASWGYRSADHGIADLAKCRSKAKERILSPDELFRLAKALRRLAITRPVPAACCQLILYRGLRVGEASRLKWAQISADYESADIPDTKTGRRIYELGSASRDLIKSRPRTSQYVFPGKEPGKPITRKAVQCLLYDACKLARIEGVSVHTLRHSWITHAAASGAPIDAIAKAVGHASVRTTLRYLHSSRETIRRTVSGIEDRIAEHAQRAHK